MRRQKSQKKARLRAGLKSISRRRIEETGAMMPVHVAVVQFFVCMAVMRLPNNRFDMPYSFSE
jgi:hypothetical protein